MVDPESQSLVLWPVVLYDPEKENKLQSNWPWVLMNLVCEICSLMIFSSILGMFSLRLCLVGYDITFFFFGPFEMVGRNKLVMQLQLHYMTIYFGCMKKICTDVITIALVNVMHIT